HAGPDDQQVQRILGSPARALSTVGDSSHTGYGSPHPLRIVSVTRQQLEISRHLAQAALMAYIRSAGLRGVRQVVAGLGGDADDLARRSGLPRGALDSDEMLVEDLAIALLLETAAAELGCPDLGLRAAGHQDLERLVSVSVSARAVRTTIPALEMPCWYLFFRSSSIEITVVPEPRGDDDVLGVRIGYRDPEHLIPAQSVDLVLLF